jgi:hypothetical protein
MSGSPVAAVVRGWVSLYTRGLPADARAARRDEIDDDLWCEHAEAATAGRSARSLDADLFLRLLFGLPADISWRLAHRDSPDPVSLERSSSMDTRTLGMLAIFAGASPMVLGILPYAMGDALWASGVGLVLAFGSFFAFPAAALGLARRFRDHIGPLGMVGAILVTLGSVLIIPVPTAGVLANPVGSAMLTWDLARIGVLSRRLAIAQLVVAILVIGLGLIPALLGPGQTTVPPIAIGVALYAYLLSWVAVGVSLIRGEQQALATSA